jgi:hypothetical protein
MTTTVYDEAGGELGYWFYCNLSKAYIAVRADGQRATAHGMNQAERFIRPVSA